MRYHYLSITITKSEGLNIPGVDKDVKELVKMPNVTTNLKNSLVVS